MIYHLCHTISCDYYSAYMFYETPNVSLLLHSPVLPRPPCHLLTPVTPEALFYRWGLGVLVDQAHAYLAYPKKGNIKLQIIIMQKQKKFNGVTVLFALVKHVLKILARDILLRHAHL